MPKITGKHFETFGFDSVGKTYIFTKSYFGHATEDYAITEYGRNSHIVLHGIAESSAGYSAIDLNGDNVLLRVASDGIIRGAGSGIGVFGSDARIINEGRIFGSADYGGVRMSSEAIDSQFINKGKFYSEGSAVLLSGDRSEVVNEKGALISCAGERQAGSTGRPSSS